ncbi:hypothetical protein M9Y10_011864 [Tritrichomonas musculus]|uniref:Uncharacterized protein n=1 Tax=Tritrichomonas musculus TaxID=1915356 RepID=A0ABR2IB55_9EUKA
MTSKTSSINTYNTDTNQKFNEIDADEARAIEEYDYEQAQFLYNSRCVMQDAHINEAKNHYEQQLQNYKERFAELLQKKQQENEDKFNHDCDEARQRLQQRIEDLDASQKAELRELEQRWREARNYQQKQVDKTVQTLLSSSQLLAKSHRYQEAIEMRDKARTMQKRHHHPNIDECDEDFQDQFKQMLLRQEQAFEELIAQHEALIDLYREKLEAANNTAEAECQIDEAYMSVEIMDTALLDTRNQDAAVAVVQHFSPRARKSGRRSLQNSSSLIQEEEEDK